MEDIKEFIFGGIGDDESISCGNHTLYWKKIDGDPEEVMVDYGGCRVPINFPAKDHIEYTLYLGDFESEKLHPIINKLREATDNDTIEIRIASNGGSIDDVLVLSNTIKERFASITTVVEANAYSAGAMIFTIGHQRIIYDNISFMIHNYSTGYGGKGGEIKSYIDYTDKHLNTLFKTLFLDNGYITKDEFNKMLTGADIWLDAKDLAERGIATHIIVGKFNMDIEAYLQWMNYKGKKSLEEWVVWKS